MKEKQNYKPELYIQQKYISVINAKYRHFSDKGKLRECIARDLHYKKC